MTTTKTKAPAKKAATKTKATEPTVTKCPPAKARGISGAKKDRPEFQRMLKDAEGGQFDVILVERLDRLSRNLSVMAGLGDLLKFYRCKIFTPSGEVSRMEIVFKGEMAQQALEEIAASTRRGLEGRGKNGKWAGGPPPYGFETALDEAGNPVRGELRKVPERVEFVRQIFKWFAKENRDYVEIANLLNKQKLPAPRGGYWRDSTIKAMLRNSAYIGHPIWKKREWVRNPETEKRVSRERPESEWVRWKDPKLRIIKDDLWKAAQDRLDQSQAAFDEQKKKRGPGTKRGKKSVYLFSGIMKCGVCGGDYIKYSGKYYRCSANKSKGEAACKNRKTVRDDVFEPKLLHAIKSELFTEDSFAEFKKAARKALEQRLKDRNKSVPGLRKQLAKVEKEIENLVSFIKSGTVTPSLSEELRKSEAEKQRLEAELDLEVPAIENIEGLFDNVVSRFARMAYDFEEFSERDRAHTRRMISNLVGGSIILRPTKDGAGHYDGGLVADVQGHFSGLVELVGKGKAPSGKAGGDKLRLVAGARNPLCYNWGAGMTPAFRDEVENAHQLAA